MLSAIGILAAWGVPKVSRFGFSLSDGGGFGGIPSHGTSTTENDQTIVGSAAEPGEAFGIPGARHGPAGRLSVIGPFAPGWQDLPAIEPAPGLPPTAEETLLIPGREEGIGYSKLHTFCTADFNRDDVIDNADASDFVQEWASREGPLAPMLDIDRDGWLTDDDLSLFFESFDEQCDPRIQMALREIETVRVRTETGIRVQLVLDSVVFERQSIQLSIEPVVRAGVLDISVKGQ